MFRHSKSNKYHNRIIFLIHHNFTNCAVQVCVSVHTDICNIRLAMSEKITYILLLNNFFNNITVCHRNRTLCVFNFHIH